MVGPVPIGVNSFEFEVSLIHGLTRRVASLRIYVLIQAAAPSPSRIPASDLIGVTVILITCSYAEQEFVRIGYYVNTEYGDLALKALYDASLEEGAQEKGITAPDPTQHIDALVRNVLGEKPRVTKFNIKWCVHDILSRESRLHLTMNYAQGRAAGAGSNFPSSQRHSSKSSPRAVPNLLIFRSGSQIAGHKK